MDYDMRGPVTAITLFTLAGGILIGGAIAVYLRHDPASPTISDQRACGTDRASHAWYEGKMRLVVCERPGGLVVREVRP